MNNIDQEREAFEAAACLKYGYTPESIASRRVGEGYDDPALCFALDMWRVRAQQGAHKPSPSFVVSLPVPVKPEEPDEGIDDSWIDAYNSAMRMRADCVAAIEQAGGQVVQGEQP